MQEEFLNSSDGSIVALADGITTDTNAAGDSNDQISEAVAAGTGTIYSYSLSDSGDVDMFKVTVSAGTRLTFTTSIYGSYQLDTYLRLFNSSGTQLAYNDDDGSSLFSSLSYTFNTSGTYYIGVSGYGNTAYSATTGNGDSASGAIGDYYFRVTNNGTTSSGDSDDTLSEARTVSNGTYSDSISSSTDVDMYSFSVQAGSSVTFTISGTSTLDSYLKLFNSSGAVLASNDDYSGRNSRITYTFTSSGTYYLGVSAYGNSGYNPSTGSGDNSASTTGSYGLTISGIVSPALTDSDDTFSEARMIYTGSYSDSISSGTDVDMYKFSVSADTRVTFTVTGASTLDSYVKLFNSSGSVLAYNDDYSGRNSQVSYTFSSAGTYYLGVSAFGNSSYNPTNGSGDSTSIYSGSYTLTYSASSTSTSTGDPDDTFSEARTVSNGTYSDSISSSTDVDMYSFSVQAGSSVTFTISGTSTLDSYLKLFNSSGAVLASNDDYSGRNSRITYTFTSSGTYYLGVSAYGNSGYNPSTGSGDNSAYSTGNYSLTASGIVATIPGDNDDTFSEARSIGNGTYSDSISVGSDVDMYKFTVQAGSSVTFTISNTSALDSYLKLFNSSGSILASNDDYSGLNSRITYTFGTSGTYYLGVSAYGNSGYNPSTGSGDNTASSSGSYSLSISGIVTPSTIATDSDDTIAEAVAVGNGTHSNSFTSGADVDMYKITVRAGDRVTFTTSGTASLDTYIRLFNASGAQLAYNDDDGTNYYSSLTYTFNAAGTYYLGVSTYSNRNFDPIDGDGDVDSASTGSYQLNISGITSASTTTDDTNDSISEAQSVSNGVISGSLSPATDVDMYKFTVADNSSVTIRTDSRDSYTVDTYLRLFDASGVELAKDDDSGNGLYSQLTFRFTTGGTYYIGVSGYGNNAYSATTGNGDCSGDTGNYSLTISGIVAPATTVDDSDDAISEARTINNGNVTDSISVGSDVDMYKFTVLAGDVVSFVTSANGSDTVDTFVRLFDSTGRQLSSNDDGGEGLYSSLTYSFSTAGTYYLGVSGYGNSNYNATTGNGDSNSGSTGNYKLTVRGISSANADSDDTIAEARELSGSVRDTITSSDVDMFKITVSAGERVTFTTSQVSGSASMDTYLRLFNSSGTQLSWDDDGGVDYFSSLTYTFNTAGTYYLGVSSYGNRNYNAVTGGNDMVGTTGGYNLTTTRYRNQRLMDQAISLGTVGSGMLSSQMRNLVSTSDIHIYRIEVAAGQTVYFDLDRASSSTLDSYIRLFNSSGTVLCSSDDCAAPGEANTRDSYMRYTFNTAGTYYVGVSSYGNSSYSITSSSGSSSGSSFGQYTLYVGNYSSGDNNDQISEAISLTVGTPMTGTIANSTDVNMYKVTVSAGQRLRFTVSLNGLGDSYLRLFNSNGTLLAANDDVSSSRSSEIYYTFSSAGTYYVGVSGYGNHSYSAVTGEGDQNSSHIGGYSISATAINQDDSYENNDSRSAAASLGVLSDNGQVTGLKMADSADWYKFNLSQATGVSGSINIDFKHSDGDLDMVLYDASGTRVGYSTSSGDRESISLANLAAGDYYLHVYGYNGALNPDYTLSYNVSAHPTTSTPPSSGGSTSSDGSNYVVLFAGGYNARNNNARYYYNIKAMYETMVEMGIDEDHIYVLFADGTNSADDLYVATSRNTGYLMNSDMSYASGSHVLSATVSNLQSVFNTLSTTVTEDDHFLFYSFDHGTEYSNGEGLCCWNEGVMTDRTFATLANSIDAKYSTYIMAQCYSGGMIEDITVRDNIFMCAAASADNPSTSGIRYDDPTFCVGFSNGVLNAFEQGINNTYELYNYAVSNDPYASRDLPCRLGNSFSIFQNIDTNSISSSNGLVADENSNQIVTTLNGAVAENSAPVVSALYVTDSENTRQTSVHAGETFLVNTSVTDPDGDDIAKLTYYLRDENGQNTLLGVNSSDESWLWRVQESILPGEYKLCVSAEDIYGNVSSLFESSIQIKAENTEPQIKDMTISTALAKGGQIVTVSGNAFDAEEDVIDNVKIYLDANQDGHLLYPEECLGSAYPDADGNWTFSFTVSNNLDRGTYDVVACAVGDNLQEGKDAKLTLEIIPGFQGDIITGPENKTMPLRFFLGNSSAYFAVMAGENYVNVLSLREEHMRYEDGEKDGVIDAFSSTTAQRIIARDDSAVDLFVARTNGVWEDNYVAKHVGNGSWNGVGTTVVLDGKNKFSDIYEGSFDANAMILSDDSNGDALFLDDVFSDAAVAQLGRLANIDEIFAGAGDDIIDLTSSNFQFNSDIKTHGGDGNDVIWAYSGNNELFGDSGNDMLVGSDGNDIIAGGVGNDTMHGGGGDDIFTFCSDWGTDTVQQLAGGSVTLWFENGSTSNWNAQTKTYSAGDNRVTVSGVSIDDITLVFGSNGDAAVYRGISTSGALDEFSSEKIFNDKENGVIVSFE